MKKQIAVLAPAKLNLTLDVLGKRGDGYHDMRMVMQSVSLCDELTLTVEPGEGILLETDLGFLPADGRNLAVAAALALRETTGADWGRLTIDLRKNIPVCAGTAGGSSDAAAVLRGLNDLLGLGLDRRELARIGEKVGSDVPYCVMGGTALCTGRGEIVEPLPPLPSCWVVMAKPAFPISTPELFARIDGQKMKLRPDTDGMIEALSGGDLAGVARRLYNVFEDALPENRRGRVAELKKLLLDGGALGACMSGTGPTVFGLFDDRSAALDALEQVRPLAPDAFLVQPV